MLEAIGNMLDVDCDAIVVTTNGYVKTNGECVMGKGIAKQIANLLPDLPLRLGNAIKHGGNIVFPFRYNNMDEIIVTFPVKPRMILSTGDNIVKHSQHIYPAGVMAAGFAAVAQLDIIEKSLQQLVELANENNWYHVVCPRFGCGAGELDWETIVKPLAQQYLDDRFTVYTFK